VHRRSLLKSLFAAPLAMLLGKTATGQQASTEWPDGKSEPDFDVWGPILTRYQTTEEEEAKSAALATLREIGERIERLHAKPRWSKIISTTVDNYVTKEQLAIVDARRKILALLKEKGRIQ
jgi:hypothetical protein